MKSIKATFTALVLTAALLFILISKSHAWIDHSLLTAPAIKNHPIWSSLQPIQAVELKTFLLQIEDHLELFLAEQEAWSRANLPNYAPCPVGLTFKATGNPNDIIERFFKAIRVNPGTKLPLYLHLMPGDDLGGRRPAHPSELCNLTNIEMMMYVPYVWVNEGEFVSPFDVLVTACDEPDYGMDLGLFTDSNTPFGKEYGFGKQPFGNPNLEFSGQAPFHMAFYHEAKILYKAGPFLKRTWLDYRIFLFKALAEFAFAFDQPYWGWRFAGWGMHYMGDMSMPYHMKPLPGVSTGKMIRVNLKSILGFPKAANNAVQLVSNRHAVLEVFQMITCLEAYNNKNFNHPFFLALSNTEKNVPFSYEFILKEGSGVAAVKGKATDNALMKHMPYKMVLDPSVEVSELPELPNLIEVMKKEKGDEAIAAITEIIADHLKDYTVNVNSYLNAIIASGLVGE